MAVHWQAVSARMTTLGPDGKLLSAITGAERDENLREMVLRMSEGCPLERCCLHCPFRILQSLSCSALKKLVAGLDRPALLELFRMERECRNHPQGQCLQRAADWLE